MVIRHVKRFFNAIFPHLKNSSVKNEEIVEKENVLKEIATFKDENLDVVQHIVKTYVVAKRGRKPGSKNKVKAPPALKKLKMKTKKEKSNA